MGKLPRLLGMVPVSWLVDRSIIISVDKLPRVLGMMPRSWLLERLNVLSWARLPRALGIVPLNLLLAMFRVRSFDSLEMLSGIVPDIEECDILNFVISPRWLITGKVPARFIRCRIDTSVTRR